MLVSALKCFGKEKKAFGWQYILVVVLIDSWILDIYTDYLFGIWLGLYKCF